MQEKTGVEDGYEDVFAPPCAIEEEEEITGISSCPSPALAHGARGRVFVRHAEERWTWEEVVAGVQVGTEGDNGGGGRGGGGVPVRWRGCSRGCLGFLDPPPPEPAPVLAQEQEEETANVSNEEEQDTEPELELDLDIGGVGGEVGDFGVGDVDMDMEDVW